MNDTHLYEASNPARVNIQMVPEQDVNMLSATMQDSQPGKYISQRKSVRR